MGCKHYTNRKNIFRFKNDFYVGVKLSFMNIRCVVVEKEDEMYLFSVHTSHPHTAPLDLDKRISTISLNAYPDDLAPTEENHINRKFLLSNLFFCEQQQRI